MFAKGPTPGATPKADALALLPEGTKCSKTSHDHFPYVVMLPNGKIIASGNTANKAWNEAELWAREQASKDVQGSNHKASEGKGGPFPGEAGFDVQGAPFPKDMTFGASTGYEAVVGMQQISKQEAEASGLMFRPTSGASVLVQITDGVLEDRFGDLEAIAKELEDNFKKVTEQMAKERMTISNNARISHMLDLQRQLNAEQDAARAHRLSTKISLMMQRLRENGYE